MVWDGQSITGDDDPFSSPTSGEFDPIDTPNTGTLPEPEPDTNDGPLPVDDPGESSNPIVDFFVRDPTTETVFSVPEEVNDGINYSLDNTFGDAVYDAVTPGDGLGTDRGDNPDGTPQFPSVEKILLGLVAVLALLVGVNAFASGTAEGLTS